MACALVIVYHLWSDRVSGGVDVFFVITGFLLVTQFVRAAERGALDVLTSWGRTLRRLVPTTAVVLLACVLAGWWVLPESRWPQTIREVTASVLLLQNWRLAADATDYYAATGTASVVQHLWSLSVQAQVAVAIPVVVLAVAHMARVLRVGIRDASVIALAVITGLSLLYSMRLTATAQELAYFHTLTRVWEFGLGGLLGLLVSRLRLSADTRVTMGWVGLIALASCGLLLDVAGGFPGWLALWPTLAACLVLAAERTGRSRGADRWLVCPALQHLGQISFALYLWHWPVLLVVLLSAGKEEAGLVDGLIVIAVSVVLAVLTERFVEQTLVGIRHGWWGGSRPTALAVVVILLMALIWQGVVALRAEPPGVPGGRDHPGALALAPGYVNRASTDLPAIPAPEHAYDDWVHYDDHCTFPRPHSELKRCTWIEPESEKSPIVVVIGDSHMQQFLPALGPVARENGWGVDTMIRGACPFSVASETVPGSAGCIAWNRSAIEEVAMTRPAAVVASASRDVRVGLSESTPPGFLGAWTELAAIGVPVLAVRDNPRFDFSPPSCVETRGRGHVTCEVPRQAVYGDSPPIASMPLPPTVHYLDIADLVCRPDVCAPEIGNVTVYLDDNHLSASYAASMAPVVGPRLAAAVRTGP